MFIQYVSDKGITYPDLTGDGTGYSLTVTGHYRSIREKAGEKVKKGWLVHSFAFKELGTWDTHVRGICRISKIGDGCVYHGSGVNPQHEHRGEKR